MNKLKNNALIKIAIHLVVWLIVFALPFIFSEENSGIEMYARGPWLPIIFSILLFYINYFFLIDKYLLKKKMILYIFVDLVLIILFILALELIREITSMPHEQRMMPENFHPHHPHNDRDFISSFAFKDFLTLLILLIFCISIKVTKKLLTSERERQRVEKENMHSTLLLLKYQMQPHFFFNSLNSIYALIERSPTMAQEALYNLGKLMRYLLHEKEFMRLDEEIEFLKKYISLMELRLRENIKVRVTFPEETERYTVAPLLFIPLIENAYKHGISSLEPSFIFIEMKLVNGRLHFIVENSFYPKDESDKSGSGIGLQNLKQRLHMIYPDKHTFLQTTENGTFRVEMILNITDK